MLHLGGLLTAAATVIPALALASTITFTLEDGVTITDFQGQSYGPGVHQIIPQSSYETFSLGLDNLEVFPGTCALTGTPTADTINFTFSNSDDYMKPCLDVVGSGIVVAEDGGLSIGCGSDQPTCPQ